MHATMRIWIVGIVLALVAPVLAGAAEPPESTDASKAKMVELKLKYPKPMFVGTPTDLKSANLEPPRKGKLPPFMIPEGMTKISSLKPVSSSDEEPIIGELELITDGDKDAGDGSFVELGPGVQWVQIDLKKQYAIHAIVLWHYHMQARVYRDIVIQISDDPDFIAEVKTVFNNDHDNSAGLGVGKTDKEWIETYQGRIIGGKGTTGRYVRMYSKGNTANDMNHYIEVEIYGKPPAE